MNTTYPRVTVAAIIAGLAGGIATAVITALTVTTLTVTTVNATTVNATALNTTTTRIGYASKSISQLNAVTSTVNPDSLTAGGCTSTSIGATGAVAGSGVIPIVPSSWLDLDQIVSVSGASAALTVNICNASTTAVNLGSADVGGWYLQQ